MVLALLVVFSNDTYAQKSKKKKSSTDEYFDEGGSLKTKLWYGGGFTLSFNGGNNYSIFQFGLSPMVGYKITDKFSMGPRFSFVAFNYKESDFNGGVLKTTPVSWDVGVFARYKIIPIIFAHVEYQYEKAIDNIYAVNNGGVRELEVSWDQRNNFLIGAGYTSSTDYALGYEILVLYNTTLPDNLLWKSPIEFRIGLTYNF